ncbi:MAG: hypothetical protein MUP58_03200 [Candidatus Nanohaloarchaeota archaeon QJJ-9]|nr:hypothetical protein [Candidatus Nanohaloarchaeota archaeon QJJ-9]
MRVIKEVDSGKNKWNSFEVGLKDGNIVIRDEAGYVDFPEEAVDKLVDSIDQARRKLREKERSPTSED